MNNNELMIRSAMCRMICENIRDFSDDELNRVFNVNVVFSDRGILIAKDLVKKGLTIDALYSQSDEELYTIFS